MWFRCYVSSCLPPPSHGIPAFAPCSDVAHSKKDCGVAVPLWLWQPELIPEPLSWSEGGRQLLVAPLLKLHQTHTLFPVAKRRPGAQALFRGHGAHTHTRLHFLYEKHQAHSTDNVVMEKNPTLPQRIHHERKSYIICCTMLHYTSVHECQECTRSPISIPLHPLSKEILSKSGPQIRRVSLGDGRTFAIFQSSTASNATLRAAAARAWIRMDWDSWM